MEYDHSVFVGFIAWPSNRSCRKRRRFHADSNLFVKFCLICPSFTLDSSSILIRWNQIIYLNRTIQMPAGLVHLPVHCPAAAKIFLLFAILLAIEAESINSGLKRQQQRFDQRFCLCIWPLPCPRTDSLHSMLFNMPNLHGSDLCRVRVCICSGRDFSKRRLQEFSVVE